MQTAIAKSPSRTMSPVLADIQAKGPRERLTDWLARLQANTARAYTHDLAHLASHLGCVRDGHPDLTSALLSLCEVPHAVAITAIESYRDAQVQAGLSSSVINRRISAINSALVELAKADVGRGALKVKLVRPEPRRDVKGPAVARIGRAIDDLAARSDPESVRDVAIILLAAQRGLRRSEIASLRVEDLDLHSGKLRVLRKGKRERVALDITGATVDALRVWLDTRPSIAADDEQALFVVTHTNRHCGRRLGDHGVWDVVRRAGVALGATWRPHGLRHTAITEALRLTGGSLPSAQTFAGHASPSTTMRYVDDKARLERQAVDALGDLYSLRKD